VILRDCDAVVTIAFSLAGVAAALAMFVVITLPDAMLVVVNP